MVEQKSKKDVKLISLYELLSDGAYHSIDEVKSHLNHKSSIKHFVEELNTQIKASGDNIAVVFCKPPYSNSKSLWLVEMGGLK